MGLRGRRGGVARGVGRWVIHVGVMVGAVTGSDGACPGPWGPGAADGCTRHSAVDPLAYTTVWLRPDRRYDCDSYPGGFGAISGWSTRLTRGSRCRMSVDRSLVEPRCPVLGAERPRDPALRLRVVRGDEPNRVRRRVAPTPPILMDISGFGRGIRGEGSRRSVRPRAVVWRPRLHQSWTRRKEYP